MEIGRRSVLGMLGGAAVASAEWPPAEGAGVPKLCLGAAPNLDEGGCRRSGRSG